MRATPAIESLWGAVGKSMTVAMLCILEAIQGKKILCCREYQNSIQESVHALIADLISQLDVTGFTVTRDRILAPAAGDDLQGSSTNAESIKSLFGTDVCWVEEARRYRGVPEAPYADNS